MTLDQTILFLIIATTMGLFIWGRLRYDMVAVLALLSAVYLGVVPADHAFRGFGHPAVITVAAVFIVSRALQISGLVDLLVDFLAPTNRNMTLQVGAIGGLAMAFSAFMNNIGALALMLPVALRQALDSRRPPSKVLMPLSFATLLGGLVTLIGTPPNIIIAAFRMDVSGEPFAMFDFTPVGLPVAIAGLAFISLVGWRLLPVTRATVSGSGEGTRFQIEAYLIESIVPEASDLVGAQVRDLERLCQNEITAVAIIREGRRLLAPAGADRILANDILILEGDPIVLERLFQDEKLEAMSDSGFSAKELQGKHVTLVEVIVMPGSPVEGQSMRGLRMHERYGVNLLALAREDRKPALRLGAIRFKRGDVLLMQGDRRKLSEVLPAIGCLPLARREISMTGRRRKAALAPTIFLLAILSAAFGLVSVPVAFVSAVAALAVTGCLTLREAYDSVEWSLIVLLGALLPLGEALQATGATALIAQAIISLAGALPVWGMLTLVVICSMLLSDLIHNSPTAVLMAPISVAIAEALQLPPEPFLMAVALGAASPYLTPIGHQSNTLVMAPGGYHFADYWRLGLPLDLVILVVGVPLIMLVWMP
jgi:di/tricarboxylate transporter